MNHIIGDSRVKGLKDIKLTLDVTEVCSKPGARIADLLDTVDYLTILHHGLENARTHFYVWVGICDITVRLRKGNYQEVIFKELDAHRRSKIFKDLDTLESKIKNEYGVPIFCPIIPLSLSVWNQTLIKHHKTSHLDHSSQYHSMQTKLEQEVITFNDYIIKKNMINNIRTPMLSQDFTHNRGKSKGQIKAYYKYSNLVDGCHPDKKISSKFTKSIIQAIKKNRS